MPMAGWIATDTTSSVVVAAPAGVPSRDASVGAAASAPATAAASRRNSRRVVTDAGRTRWRSARDELRLEALELGVVDRAARLEVGQLGELVGGAAARAGCRPHLGVELRLRVGLVLHRVL